MIPKKIHYCWFGQHPLPEDAAALVAEWKTIHPDWEIICWNESNSPLAFPYMEKAHALKKWANMSNFIRLYALKEQGGVYLDTDVKLLKPLTELLRCRCFLGFEEGSETSSQYWVNNAVCGSEPGHPFIVACFEALLQQFDGAEMANLSGPRLTTGMLQTTRGLQRYGAQVLGDVTLLETEALYPVHYSEIYKLSALERYVSGRSYGVHLWARTWLDKDALLSVIDGLYEELSRKQALDPDRRENDRHQASKQYGMQLLLEHYLEREQTLEARALEYSQRASALKEKLAELERQYTLQAEALEREKNDRAGMAGELKALEDSRIKLEFEIRFLETANHKLENRLMMVLAEKEKFRTETREAQKALQDVSAELEKTRFEYELLNQKVQAEYALIHSEREAGAQELSDLKAKQQELLAENTGLHESLMALNTAHRNMQDEAAIASSNNQAELLRMQNEIKYLKSSVSWYQATFEHRSVAAIWKDRIMSRRMIRKWVPAALGGSVAIRKAKRKTNLPFRVLCVIANHNCDENALKLKKALNPYFDTVVLDSGSSNPPRSFHKLGNVYYSGLANKAFELAREKQYSHLFFICSDVEFSGDEVKKMVHNLEANLTDQIGIYSPSSTGRSHSFCKRKALSGLRSVPFTEGFVFLARLDVLKPFFPVDLNVNKMGWGLDVAKGYFARQAGKYCVIDDGVSVYHPESTGYSNDKAEQDMWHWVNSFADEGFKRFFHNQLTLLRRGEQEKFLVSIVIPCYNQEAYIRDTLHSCLLQEYANLEIMVVNDGSTDGSEEMVKPFVKIFPQIKWISKTNGGLGSARNKGMAMASGQLLQFLDADDQLSTDKILNQVMLFANHSEIDISYTPYLCYEDGNPENTWTYSRVEMRDDPALDLIENWEKDLSIPVHCFLYRKAYVQSVRFDEELPNHEDWLFHLQTASLGGRFGYVPYGLALYRVRTNSMARDRQLMRKGKLMCLRKALAMPGFSATCEEAIHLRMAECDPVPEEQ